MANKQSTSPWVWIGCGCFALVALVVGGFATLGFFGAKAVRDFEAEIKDPVLRDERARTILGAEQLPDGFSAQFHLRIPFLLEMVSLSDGEPLEYDEERHQARLRSENLGERAFIYLAMRDVGDARDADVFGIHAFGLGPALPREQEHLEGQTAAVAAAFGVALLF